MGCGSRANGSKLQAAAPSHPYAADLAEKSKAFDDAAARFAIAA